VSAGHIPDIDEGVAWRDYLRKHGPSAHTFGFRQRFEPGQD
jgi:hypothetical protein